VLKKALKWIRFEEAREECLKLKDDKAQRAEQVRDQSFVWDGMDGMDTCSHCQG
jgi:hypothetical protein